MVPLWLCNDVPGNRGCPSSTVTEATVRTIATGIGAIETGVRGQHSRSQLRIATLEQQIEQEKQTAAEHRAGTVSAAELAAEKAAGKILTGNSNQVGAKFQGQLAAEPSYDQVREADIAKLKEQVGAFEFHGYFRSGYGLNSVGGQQVAFQAPGTEAKYRLGNEAETYGEFIFVNN